MTVTLKGAVLRQALEDDPGFYQACDELLAAQEAFIRVLEDLGDQQKARLCAAADQLANAAGDAGHYAGAVEACAVVNQQLLALRTKAASTSAGSAPNIVFGPGSIQLQLPAGGLDVNVHQEPHSAVVERDAQGRLVGVSVS